MIRVNSFERNSATDWLDRINFLVLSSCQTYLNLRENKSDTTLRQLNSVNIAFNSWFRWKLHQLVGLHLCDSDKIFERFICCVQCQNHFYIRQISGPNSYDTRWHKYTWFHEKHQKQLARFLQIAWHPAQQNKLTERKECQWFSESVLLWERFCE